MKIIKDGNEIKVESPYNENFVARAKEIGGKWSKPYWVFTERVEERLNEILIAVYGEGFEKVDTVDIEIDLDAYMSYGAHEVTFKGLTIARRVYRDSSVIISENAFVNAGAFEKSGGSRSNPRVTWNPGTTVVVSVPKTLVGDLPKGVKLIDKSIKAKLEEEKNNLIKRISEIDKILKDLS